MGFIHFYDDSTLQPTFTLSDLDQFIGSVSEMVLNVTWAQLQPTQGGPLNTQAIEDAINLVTNYNSTHSTNLGIKLRVWGGVTAPDWAKNINGPAITITGQASVDPTNFDPRTIGRVWSADYIDAWAKLQQALATTYDSNPVIRGISQTAGGTASDEPFVALSTDAPISHGSATTVDQVGQLVAGGYTDMAEMLTLRAAIADYAAWSTTPLDYTINPFHTYANGTLTLDENFSLAVLQQARNSSRLVQAGNHALDNPEETTHPQLPYLYAQYTADAALTYAATPNSYQTASPDKLAQNTSSNFPTFPTSNPNLSNWPQAVANGIAANGGNVELWDFSGPTGVNGFLTLSTQQMALLAQMVASGVAPTTDAPDDGSDLGFLAPASISGPAGAIGFSGTSALLLASAAAQTSYTVTLTSVGGHMLSVVDHPGIVSGATSGTTLTFTGTLDAVNTVLASLTDSLASGTDVVHIAATDSGGHSASRNVGVEVAAASSSNPNAYTPPAAFQGNGMIVLGGVQASLTVPGNLQIGSGGTATNLFAALAPSAYSSATLAVGGTVEVLGGGTAYFTGLLAAPTVTIDSGGLLAGAGILNAAGSSIANNGTIEAVADMTLGLQRLAVVDDLTGSGTLLIDAAATLVLEGTVANTQAIQFAANTVAQLANYPTLYSPSTLVLTAPSSMSAPIRGFTWADRLVLENVTVTGASYASGVLTVTTSSGTLTYDLTGVVPGDLDALTLDTDPTVLGQGIIRFLPPASPTLPSGITTTQILVTGTTEIRTDQVTVTGTGGVAVRVDGNGALAVAGGAVVTAEQQVIVGNSSEGLLVVMGGALSAAGTTSTAPALVIGANNGSTGTVLDLEQITANGTVIVGQSGTGTLELLGVAATVSDNGAIIGEAAGSHGTVLVNGGEWMNAGGLTVGGSGIGTLTIDGAHNGITGQVTAYNVTIGNQAGSHGTVQLDGGEMLVANFNATLCTLAVGVLGTGELLLEDGSEVAVGLALASSAQNTGRLTVGSGAGGQGTVQIGNNSSVLVYGNATVGGAGNGTVTVGETANDVALLALLGTLAVDANGQVDLGGASATVRASTVDIAAGGRIAGAGTLSGDRGGNQTILPAAIDNDGTIEATGGNLLLYGDISGTGTLAVASGATLILEGEVGSGQTLAFSSHATVVIADPTSFHGTITGFDASDVLVIGGVRATAVSWSSGTLTIDLPSGPLQYILGGNFDDGFTTNANNLGGSNIRANPGGVGGGHGDVHMITFNGLLYDFQAIGDYVVLQSVGSSSPWEIQMRTISAAGATSITEVLGTMLGDDHVTFAVGRDSVVHVNSAPDTSLQVGDVQRLSGGTLARLSSTFYQLDWNDGRSVTVTDYNGWFLDWTVALGPQYGPGSVHGLLGSFTGPGNDFQLPNGTVLGGLNDDQIRTFYADAWRVALGASLLDDSQARTHAQLAQAMATGLDPAGAAGPVTPTEDAMQLAVGALLTTPQHA